MNDQILMILYSVFAKYIYVILFLVLTAFVEINESLLKGFGLIGQGIIITSLISSLTLILVSLNNLTFFHKSESSQKVNLDKVGLIVGTFTAIGPVLELILGKQLNYAYMYGLGILSGIYLIVKGYELRKSSSEEDKVLSTICFVTAFIFMLCSTGCELKYNYHTSHKGRANDLDLSITTTIPRSNVFKQKMLFPVKS